MEREKTVSAGGAGVMLPSFAAEGTGLTDDSTCIDLNDHLIHNRQSTFFFRMNGDAMINAGIQNGDILVVDSSLKATHGKIIVAAVNGEMVVRRFEQGIRGMALVAEHPRYEPIAIGEFTQFSAFGLVTCVIHVLEKNLLNKHTVTQRHNRK